MSASPQIPDKLFFRIGEVAKIVGVKPHVLRYWETEFNDIRPQKTKSNHRVYARKDVETLLLIKDLLHKQRFTIEGARKALRTRVAPPKKRTASQPQQTASNPRLTTSAPSDSPMSEPTSPAPSPDISRDDELKTLRSEVIRLRSETEAAKARSDALQAELIELKAGMERARHEAGKVDLLQQRLTAATTALQIARAMAAALSEQSSSAHISHEPPLREGKGGSE